MTARIALTPEMRDRLKDIADGMGITYDALFRLWVNKLVPPNKEDLLYGYEMRDEAQAFIKKHGLEDTKGKK